MKLPTLFLTAAAALLILPGCREKTIPEKVNDRVGDALDNRPAEPVRDAAEDVKDEAKEAGRAIDRKLD